MQIPCPDEEQNIPSDAHSVLTGHFNGKAGHPTRKAMDEVLAFFADKLKANAA